MMNPVRPADPGKPWLATKWTWSEQLPAAGRSPSATASSGPTARPMTADDVAYTFQLLKDNAGAEPATRCRSATSRVSGNTVDADVPDVAVRQPDQGAAASSSCRSTSGRTIADPTTDTNQNPIGTGPYTLKSFTPQTVTLTERTSATGRRCRRSRSFATPPTAATTRRRPRWPTARAEWSFVFIPNAKADLRRQGPGALQALVPADAGHPRPVVQHHEEAVRQRRSCAGRSAW